MSTPLRYFIALLLLSPLFSGSVSFAQTLPSPSHIVILWEENYAYSQIIGSVSAPHINALAADTNAAVFTKFYAIEHPSQPNYIDFFSGANQGVTDDNLPSVDVPSSYPFTTPNLGAELIAAGKTFTTYSENLPSVGFDGATYTSGGANYARKHNPCTNWVGTAANQFANTVNQPFSALPANYASLPTVSFVVPNMTNDMHDYTCTGSTPLPCPESIELGDTWEYTNMDSLRKWSLANNTLYIIIYDEDDDNHDNNIPAIFYGPMVKGGTYSENVNLFNLLRTVEDIYSTGHAGAAATSTAITDCWKTTAVVSHVGVNNVTGNTYSFKVVPNPATDVITFNCSNSLATPATIHVSDETGRNAGTYNMSGTDLQVNTSAFAPGMYVYKVTDNNNKVLGEGKFVIVHN